MAPLFGDALFYILPLKSDSLLSRRAAVQAALDSAGATRVSREQALLADNAERLIRLCCGPYCDQAGDQARALPWRRGCAPRLTRSRTAAV